MLLSPSEVRPAWLLVRTKPKQERAAVETLEGRGLKAYCPLILEPRTHTRSPRGPMPLFPSYVFAHCVLPERFAAVNFCPGIAGVVRFGDRFAAVEDVEIDGLREKEKEHGYIVIARIRKIPEKGSRVRITAGPLKDFQGIVEEYIPSRDRVRLLLRYVSGVWRAQVGADYIQRA